MVIPGIAAAVDSLRSRSDDIPVPCTPPHGQWLHLYSCPLRDPVTDSLTPVKELLVPWALVNAGVSNLTTSRTNAGMSSLVSGCGTCTGLDDGGSRRSACSVKSSLDPVPSFRLFCCPDDLAFGLLVVDSDGAGARRLLATPVVAGVLFRFFPRGISKYNKE